MKDEEIEVRIAPDGKLKLEAHNFQGSLCEKELNKISEALGKKTEEHHKPEYYKKPIDTKQKLKQG